MSETSDISVERIDRKLYEAETNGLLVRLNRLDEDEIIDGEFGLTFDVISIPGDGEKSYDVLSLPEHSDVVAGIREFVTAKLEEVDSRLEPYFIMEREIQRRKTTRNPAINKSFEDENTLVITAGETVFTFKRNTSAPVKKDGNSYVLYAYSDATGTVTGEVEIVGDHAPLYEFLPLVEAQWRIQAVRKQLLREKTGK